MTASSPSMPSWRQHTVAPLPLLRSLQRYSDTNRQPPEGIRKIDLKSFCARPMQQQGIFREIEIALKMTGFLWEKGGRLKSFLNVLLIMCLMASHVYLLKCAVSYETLDFVLYGTRIVAANATCFVAGLKNETHKRIIKDLSEHARTYLPQRRLSRIKTLSRALTAASVTIVLAFFTPPTYLTSLQMTGPRPPC
ncbi:hypothetical protein HPB48_011518 [Haemaphysalis longicornis]|uniref:Uncharacterized protein n=1 Tax=Haemaphysalis longicornis TaxID=44386 RepID=A0A9J6G556_HAELO|nr:hypothetical protein HPB48_011518 [Haemaphysalis longicornis]